MIYDVSRLLEQNIGVSCRRKIEGHLVDIDENNPGLTHLAGMVQFVRTVKGVLARGKVHLVMTRTCCRCLGPFEDRIEFAFEEEFVPSVDVETGASLPVEEKYDADLIIGPEGTLDLKEILRQYTVMASSAPVVGDPDCKGLCPICGVNLNEESCDCERSFIDPRMAVLGQLLEE
ncbi:MAG: YceD family protein [Anaerolineales bacterium]